MHFFVDIFNAVEKVQRKIFFYFVNEDGTMRFDILSEMVFDSGKIELRMFFWYKFIEFSILFCFNPFQLI